MTDHTIGMDNGNLSVQQLHPFNQTKSLSISPVPILNYIKKKQLVLIYTHITFRWYISCHYPYGKVVAISQCRLSCWKWVILFTSLWCHNAITNSGAHSRCTHWKGSGLGLWEAVTGMIISPFLKYSYLKIFIFKKKIRPLGMFVCTDNLSFHSGINHAT